MKIVFFNLESSPLRTQAAVPFLPQQVKCYNTECCQWPGWLASHPLFAHRMLNRHWNLDNEIILKVSHLSITEQVSLVILSDDMRA